MDSAEGIPLGESHPLRMFYTYILRSQKDGTYYYGSCKDLTLRVKEHKSGKGEFIKGHRLWEMKYYEEYDSRSDAYKRERFFKTIDGYRWRKENKMT